MHADRYRALDRMTGDENVGLYACCNDNLHARIADLHACRYSLDSRHEIIRISMLDAIAGDLYARIADPHTCRRN